MISNSVTHRGVIPTLQSPETPCRYRRKLRASADITMPSADVAAPSADIIALNGECPKCFMMFDNVLRAFQDVLLVVQVLRVFHNVSRCFISVS